MESQAGPSSGNSTGRRRVWPWVVGAVVVLLALLIGVVILILVVAPSGISSGGGGGSAQRVSWDEEYVSGGGPDKIAVLPVSGEISEESSQGLLSGGSSATPGALQSQLDQAAGRQQCESRDSGSQLARRKRGSQRRDARRHPRLQASDRQARRRLDAGPRGPPAATTSRPPQTTSSRTRAPSRAP